MIKTERRILALMLTFALIFSALSGIALPSPAHAASDGTVRVKLTRLGSPTSISFTTSCAYYVNGSSAAIIPSGSSATVALSDGSLILSFGGKSYDMGGSFYISRASGGNVGAKFTSPSLSNIYCGDLKFSAGAASITTLLAIYVEDYLYGVVGYEMSNSWSLEALKAQAIAARTYVLKKQSQRKNYSYDVTDSTTDQVYMGYNSSQSNVHSAVNGTRGVVAMYGTSLAQCYYTASNGGQTESTKNIWGGSLAYSVVKYDPYDFESSGTRRSAVIRKDASGLHAELLECLLSGMAGDLRSFGLSTDPSDITINRILSVTANSPLYGSPSVLFQSLTFQLEVTVGTHGAIVEAEVPTYGGLETWYSLSINKQNNETVRVTESDDVFTVTFRRFGHGVGMSQCGAQVMAKNYGMRYAEILEFYYPGVKLSTLSLTDSTGGASGSAPLPGEDAESDDDGDETAPDLTGTIPAQVALGSKNVSDEIFIYSTRSTGGEKLATLRHGDAVYVFGVSGSWAHVTDGTVTGYALSSRLLQLVSGEMWCKAAQDATLYEFVGAGKVKATVSKGEYLSVYSYNGDTAYCMDASGNKGFIPTAYLVKAERPSDEPADEPTAAPTAQATATPTPTPTAAPTKKPGATLPPPSSGEPMATLPPPSAGDSLETEAPEPDSEPTPAPTPTPTPTPTATPTPKPAEGDDYVYAIVALPSDDDRAYLFDERSSSSDRNATLRHGDILRVYSYSGSWGYAKNENGDAGYARLDSLLRKPESAMYVQFLYDGKLFSHMDTSASRTATVSTGDYARVIAYNGDAAYVETRDGARGFVLTKYLRKVSASQANW